ncbi:hypothetical protein C2S53_003621 [Perilla frutescens var. hirtella]|uniref:Uncharacterized protein n=1 Tax=Perilla frutescens var. hirtella TaxID=608512 RepID=A0AAD4PDD2_PERFH|nr:hypothetical protein C2S53_003621 [Perilla frutescens var. hirtella]
MLNIVENKNEGLVNLVEINVSSDSIGAKENDGEAPTLKVATKIQVTKARGRPTAKKPGSSPIESNRTEKNKICIP